MSTKETKIHAGECADAFIEDRYEQVPGDPLVERNEQMYRHVRAAYVAGFMDCNAAWMDVPPRPT